MKCITLSVAVFFFAGTAFAQKRPIDSDDYGKWPFLSSAELSNDGNYVLYKILTGDGFIPNPADKLIVKSTKSDRGINLPYNATEHQFTADSRFLIFRLPGDSIGIVNLDAGSMRFISNVTSFKISASGKNYLLYKLNNQSRDLVINDLVKESHRIVSFVNDYLISANGSVLVTYVTDSNKMSAVNWTDIDKGISTKVWQGFEAQLGVLDRAGMQLVFHATEVNDADTTSSYMYFKEGDISSRKLIDPDKEADISALSINRIMRFSNDGQRVFLELCEKKLPAPDPNNVKLNVWSYTDPVIQSIQLDRLAPQTYFAVFDINNRKLIRLQFENEELSIPEYRHGFSDAYELLVKHNGGVGGERFWNKLAAREYYLISLKTGTRTKLDGLTFAGQTINGLSPERKYYVYYDPATHNYFSVEIATGAKRNITKGISVKWTTCELTRDSNEYPMGLAGWLKGDAAVFIYDEFDIWQIDPLGEKRPINLTGNYGKANNICFEPISNDPDPVKDKEFIVLAGFNPKTKKNGFYKIKAGTEMTPVSLMEGNYYYYALRGATRVMDSHIHPKKAKNADMYLYARMSSTESPNLFVTSDFIHTKQLTNISPEKDVNWYTTELHKWTSPKGLDLMGVLYKPENFDSSKKYPVIFYYYEVMSNNLNFYVQPKPSGGELNIAWYVSNGYLVFTPDIDYKIGDPFSGTYDCVMSAASYVAGLPYVNEKKMGIQGISWGGIQTNYLVTHTDLFAAVCSASGTSDFISQYNSISHGESSQSAFEWTGQYRAGFTLWERPDWYINNSPIMSADKVTSPFLMFHTSVDGACPFPQALELFTGLRRLGKKVWMLEYNDGNHGVSGPSAYDFSIRMSQFFDHYLKDKPAPKWMLNGIPARLKGVDMGLGLDSTKSTPGEGLVIKENEL